MLTVQSVWQFYFLLVALIRRRRGLLSAIGIAGMDRVAQFNVIATSGRAEACGDVNTLVRPPSHWVTAWQRSSYRQRHSLEDIRVALAASVFDETPEGKSIVRLKRVPRSLTAAKPKELSFPPKRA